MSEGPIDIPAARHERTDVGEGLIWITAAALIGLLALCGAAVFWLYPQSGLDRTLSLPLPIFPAPRLQANPAKDMQALRIAEERRLESSGWVDRNQGVVHIPISEAMRSVAQEGIAGWPVPAADAAGASP